MTTLQFVDTHNLVVFFTKSAESEGFEQIVDFLNASSIKYTLTVNPTIYTSCIEQFWSTIKAKMVNGEVQLQALVDGKKIVVNKAYVRRYLQLEDADVFLDNQLEGMINHNRIYIAPSHTKKVFGNMKRQGKDFSGRVTPFLERATTTATGLDAEQDRGNISKTQSKAIPNEPSSIRTSSCGGPRRQDTMGDTIAQTRSENVSKSSNDPMLAGVNTPRSGDDSMQLKELMEFCNKLQQRVLDLENTKTAQAQEITSLKKRVKKLERKKKSRTHGLKRLY
ncbi:hypothetical protein Tco_0747966 [Tanacetum coccineum]|uniref:Xylulose kinase-1 n=1 Tax=Tanacetum coccineum TaxID=301880 RepID=A0ABQ4YV65_9ASTR